MKARIILACVAAMCLAITASAQDLKPVKDRDTKKFGYQDKSKNWVIEPTFDKANRFNDGYAVVEVQGLEGLIDQSGAWVLRPEYNNIGKFDKLGLCELMNKIDHTRYYGIADRSGRIIMPVKCLAVNASRSDGVIYARLDADPDGNGPTPLWGVYDLDGDEIFAPQFSSSPSFYKGIASATSGVTGLKGIIDDTGNVLLPFENLAIESASTSPRVLGADFTIRTYDSNMNITDELRNTGSIIPYETAGDDVRIAAWHSGCIGRRLYVNNVKDVQVSQGNGGRMATCSNLQLDWGYGRFIRLEPEIDSANRPGSMEHPYNGKFYTLRALMYEANGAFVGIVSDWGWLEGEFNGGFIYNSEGDQKWIIFDDINYPVMRNGFGVTLHGYRPIEHSSVISGLCLTNQDLKRQYSMSNRKDRVEKILQGENIGINSYLPRMNPNPGDMRYLDRLMHGQAFRTVYHMGDVVNCKVEPAGEEMRIRLDDKLIVHFKDEFHNPSYKMEGDELIYWGPNNARTVGLRLELADRRDELFLADDVNNDNRKLKVVIVMYDESGNYLRTLGEAPCPDFNENGVMVFEKLGIALIDRGPRRGPGAQYGAPGAQRINPGREIKVPAANRLAPKLSALTGQQPPHQTNAPEPGKDVKNLHQPGGTRAR
ncbi:MAG: WG repeat-containing protein [Bacteroidales bacterium]|nr:WG repeat-containing protein [Bacteroidales bacterium]